MKFNNRIIRKILIRDTHPESSIVALYKKLELQNAMEILDSMSNDISAAPALTLLQYVSFCPMLLRNLRNWFCVFFWIYLILTEQSFQ